MKINTSSEYNFKERFALWILAVVVFFVFNAVFLYALIFQREILWEALKNPVSLAFIGESLLLMFAFAYLLSKWGQSKLHWGWFIALSLFGGIGFALPLVLLWPFRRSNSSAKI